jgi:predicted secreted protein
MKAAGIPGRGGADRRTLGSPIERARRLGAAAIACAVLALACAAASAGPVLSLEARARATVANDEMVVTLGVQRDGPQVGPLNEAVVAQLNAALAEARRVDGVQARLGSVWTQPVTHRDGRPQGWRVGGEVVLESTRIDALSRLGGQLAERMQLSGVQFRLSRAARAREEKRLVAEAARAFRERAAEAATAFGFAGYELKELSLRTAGDSPPRPMAMARGGMEAASAPLPAEGGDSDVVVTVGGSVELKP